MTITIKANTAAAKCNAEGVFSSNIRPNIYTMNKVSTIVKSGHNGTYAWYVVEYYESFSFVTEQDIVK